MIQTTMHALLIGSVVPPRDEYIYIVRSGEDVMYVGKTNDPSRRIEEHYAGTFFNFSVDDRRDVWRWTVEIRKIEECQEYISPMHMIVDIDVAEQDTIRVLGPVLNATYNVNPSPMPQRYKRLFEIEVGATDNLY